MRGRDRRPWGGAEGAPQAATQPVAPGDPAPADTAPVATQPPVGGPVSLDWRLDFTGEQIVSLLDVSLGAGLLGCASGSSVEEPIGAGVERVVTCESGEREGTFTILLKPQPGATPNEELGPWEITSGNGGFGGLGGGGDFTVVFDDGRETAEQLMTGEIRWAEPDEHVESAVPDEIDEAFLDELLDELLEDVRVADTPGSVMVAHIDADGAETTAVKVTSPGGAPLRPSDPFRVGSISKVLASLVILSLVDEGRIDLDAPAADCVTSVQIPEDITVRHLLQHRSGIPSYTDEPGFFDDVGVDDTRRWTPEEPVELVIDQELEFEPGAEFRYSNTNYAVLGLLAQDLTGQPYHDLVKDRIVEPAGLERTYLAGHEEGPAPVGAYTDFAGDLV